MERARCFIKVFVIFAVGALFSVSHLPMVQAMNFSPPEFIGSVFGVTAESANAKMELPSSIQGEFFDFANNNQLVRYYVSSKSIHKARVGAPNDFDGAVAVGFSHHNGLYSFNSDSGYSFYIVEQACKCAGGPTVTVIGSDANRKYKKYADYQDFKAAFSGETPEVGYMGLRLEYKTNKDKLIISCQGLKRSWDYILSWNSIDQRFLVEFVMHPK